MSDSLTLEEAAGSVRTSERPAWAAVGAMTLGVFGLVTAEFLPASLLTPMAAELGITEGAAGQAVTATALVALVASLFVAALTQRIDRRHLLIGFSVLLVISNLCVAFAPNLALLGIGLVTLQGSPMGHAALIALWGLAFGAVPVAWSTWLTRTVPDQAETAGGLLVAAVQLAISVGAAGGGLVFEMDGASGVFAVASLVLLVAALIVLLGVRTRRAQTA